MIFPKNDTNYIGEPLCCSCRHNEPVKDLLKDSWCNKDQCFHRNVGVCKDYETYKDNN